MTETDVIAGVIVTAVKEATGPMAADMAALMTRITTIESVNARLMGSMATMQLELDAKGNHPNPADVEALIRPILAEAVAALPVAKDGRDGIDGKDGAPGRDGERGEKGDPGLIGERGPEGPAGLMGRDGQPGVPGRDGAKGIDGAAGRDGLDGKDGLGFDDLSVLHDGERGFTVRFTQGDRAKDFPFTIPFVIYRGVFVQGTAYERGDSVTWAGAMWVAKETTTAKPGDGVTGWQLAVKAGREGKQGPDGKPGPSGPRGDKGDPGPRW